jgi:hypothetical protein
MLKPHYLRVSLYFLDQDNADLQNNTAYSSTAILCKSRNTVIWINSTDNFKVQSIKLRMSVNPYVLLLVRLVQTDNQALEQIASKQAEVDRLRTDAATLRAEKEQWQVSSRSLCSDLADEYRATNIDYRLISDLSKMNGLSYNSLLIISIVLGRRVKKADRKIGRGWRRELRRFKGNREFVYCSLTKADLVGRHYALSYKKLGMLLPLPR